MKVPHGFAATAMVACRNLIDAQADQVLQLSQPEAAVRVKEDEKILRLVVGSWCARMEITELTKLEADAAIKRWTHAQHGGSRPVQRTRAHA